MNLRNCDCCGKRSKELSRTEVGSANSEWFVCADCYNYEVPRIPRDTDVPLLSRMFPFGGGKR
jgi:ribosome-binding protein aMBF1 (putative translation factor)